MQFTKKVYTMESWRGASGGAWSQSFESSCDERAVGKAIFVIFQQEITSTVDLIQGDRLVFRLEPRATNYVVRKLKEGENAAEKD
jgi:hypothetical protein